MKKTLLLLFIIGIIITGLQAFTIIHTPTPKCDSAKAGNTIEKTATKQKISTPVNTAPLKKSAAGEFNFFMNPFIKLYQLIIPTS